MPKRALPPLRVLLRLLLASNRYFLIPWISIKVPNPLKQKSFSQEWKQNIEIARSYLEKAQKRYKKSVDLKRHFLEFNVGDLVMVKLLDRNVYKLTRGKDSRLVPKYIGSLPIVKRIGRVAYKVALPSWCKIHKVLHVGILKSYFADKEDASRNEPKRPVFKLRKAGKKVAETILDYRTNRASRKYHQEYFVKWSGCNSEGITWERKKRPSSLQTTN